MWSNKNISLALIGLGVLIWVPDLIDLVDFSSSEKSTAPSMEDSAFLIFSKKTIFLLIALLVAQKLPIGELKKYANLGFWVVVVMTIINNHDKLTKIRWSNTKLGKVFDYHLGNGFSDQYLWYIVIGVIILMYLIFIAYDEPNKMTFKDWTEHLLAIVKSIIVMAILLAISYSVYQGGKWMEKKVASLNTQAKKVTQKSNSKSLANYNDDGCLPLSKLTSLNRAVTEMERCLRVNVNDDASTIIVRPPGKMSDFKLKIKIKSPIIIKEKSSQVFIRLRRGSILGALTIEPRRNSFWKMGLENIDFLFQVVRE